MIANISPAKESAVETKSTLQFATRAKRIKNSVRARFSRHALSYKLSDQELGGH